MTSTEQAERRRVLDVARSWVSTPFHDNARLKGIGVDCAQLLAAIYEEAGIMIHVATEHYSPQFFLHRDEERFLSYVTPRTFEIEEKDAKPADFLVYKIGRVFAHGAIIIEPGWPHILHAYSKEGFVTTGLGDAAELGPRPRRFFRPKQWER